ncbi:hypothetical protein BC936DRAFT_143003, partial [Jimgerdemannia flammicorona]
MAIDILLEENHDIESFLYVLPWICSEFERLGRRRKKAQEGENRFSVMWKVTFEAIAFRKKFDKLLEFNKVLNTFSKFFDELKEFVRKFHNVLFPKAPDYDKGVRGCDRGVDEALLELGNNIHDFIRGVRKMNLK